VVITILVFACGYFWIHLLAHMYPNKRHYNSDVTMPQLFKTMLTFVTVKY